MFFIIFTNSSLWYCVWLSNLNADNLVKYVSVLAGPCGVTTFNHTIEINQCVSLEQVELASCSGGCESMSTFSPEPPYYMQNCSCCVPMKFDRIYVKMLCKHTYSTMKFYRIRECLCKQCTHEKHTATATHTESSSTPSNIEYGGRKKRSLAEYFYNMFGED